MKLNGHDKYIVAIDQGTTGTRAVVFGHEGKEEGHAYRELTQYYPQPGWVEHNPVEIWQTALEAVVEALAKAGISSGNIAAIGITNQRETSVLWDGVTGEPVYNAVVWQCRRTAALCRRLQQEGYANMIQEKTGLIADPYFSGTKLKWMLDNVPAARRLAAAGRLRFGTVDSWLAWKLTGGEAHVTDYTNASRTMLFNIHTLEWDRELLELLALPSSILPAVKSSSEVYGHTARIDPIGYGIPIAGIAGDQQSALFGQACRQPGMTKNTYGTGCFILLNTGSKPMSSDKGLLTTIACDSHGKPGYALEGSIFSAGAAIQWLRDGLGLITSPGETEALAQKVADTAGVYVIPAFTGLGAPYWDMYARAAILGITRGTTKEHIVRAFLESIAYQVRAVLDLMSTESDIAVHSLRVDGGAAQNDFLMQFQADILGIPVERPQITETTALGAALLAGLAVGYWSEDEVANLWHKDRVFEPKLKEATREELYRGWKKAVSRVLTKA